MSLITKSSNYAPDIYKALQGVLLLYKPARINSKAMIDEIKTNVTDSLNRYSPRPISKRIVIKGDIDARKKVVQVPNLADHPLVVGPRYLPWEFKMKPLKSTLEHKSSGLEVHIVGTEALRRFSRLFSVPLVSVYEISGKFGYLTDTFMYDGKIIDKCSYQHIRTGKLDSVLSRIEAGQRHRLFDSAHVSLNSQEAYELAKAWPSRPARSAKWPVIYRLRCTHMKLPDFKIEVTVSNEKEQFLAHLVQDIGLLLKSGAYTTAIRRTKLGMFDVNDSITDRDWNLQGIIDNLSIYQKRYEEIDEYCRRFMIGSAVRIDEPSESIMSDETNARRGEIQM